MRIKAPVLTKLATDILSSAGAPPTESDIVATHLVEANLAGHDSHGVGLIPTYIEGIKKGQLNPSAAMSIELDRGPFTKIDGNSGFGQVIARKAMELAISKARESFFSVLALKNSYHIGRVGAWGEMAANAGFISIHYVNAHSPNSLVAPFGGSDARFTTNPYVTAIPSTNHNPPVILDMATSKIAMGKVRVAFNEGIEVPPDSLIDNTGNPTNDPSVMFREPKGALRSMGLHKGYGLALVCDILAGALTGGGTFGPEKVAPGKIINNMLAIVLDPSVFCDQKEFEADVDKFTKWVKESPPGPNVSEVMFPGDPERKCRGDRLSEGIPIDQQTWNQIIEVAEKLGINYANT